jgi:sterol desaturase/sphingolipid hydroxylase (fatty acid hydroxylase superfamily)
VATAIFAGLIIIAIIAFMAVIEELIPIGDPVGSRRKGIAFNLIGSAGAGMLVFGLSKGWTVIGITPVAIVPVRGWVGDAAAGAAALIFFDFLAYWNHRFQHRFLWRVHVLHHSVTNLHAANNYAHFSERGFRFLLFAVPLSMVRFEFAAVPFFVSLARSALEFYIHSPTRIHFGPFSKLFVDNRFHRIHHSLERRHFDKNFGIMLSVWDRLFGTAWNPRPGEWPLTGVAGIAPPRSAIEYLLFPLGPQMMSRGVRKLAAFVSAGVAPSQEGKEASDSEHPAVQFLPSSE